MSVDSLDTARVVEINDRELHYYSLEAAEAAGAGPISRLPRSLKVLYENLLRHEDGVTVTRDHLMRFATSLDPEAPREEIWFSPTRILMNDSAGIPLMADMAALRGAMARAGKDPDAINPQIQSDLVVDHSVMVDRSASADAFDANLALEYDRNEERYTFLRWARDTFSNFRAVPPGTGICHQVNLEALARCVWTEEDGNRTLVFPETLLGTDSHTPMINGIGVLGWGVGGIEAGAAMLGQPVTMIVPPVVGCRLDGELPPGANATDLVLAITERLREVGVVGTFVEFHGGGLASLPLSDRATLANMAPEYGATMGFFPIDGETLRYLGETNRGGEHLELVERYCRLQGLWHDPADPAPIFAREVVVDLSEVVPAIAGPKRPQDRVLLAEAGARFRSEVLPEQPPLADGAATLDSGHVLRHGDIVIASITSCTNTSNPSVMLAAGLLAQKAVAKGLTSSTWTKTSMAPGSRVVTDYLEATGLQKALDALGFQCVGYGCATCMGNSGPLPDDISAAIQENDVCAVAVLSGNRNFEGRVHPLTKANYIASPPLIVAYAIAGNMGVDLLNDPLGTGNDGQPVYFRDIWPSAEEVADLARSALTADRFRSRYSNLFEGDARWKAIEAPRGATFTWPGESLYIKEPPFFDGVTPDVPPVRDILGARALGMYGDSITTDHISPVGTITASSAAGEYLIAQGVAPADFNSFAARRINHDVMIRGAFANIRIANEMVPEKKGGWTRHQPSGEVMPVHEAARHYAGEGTPLVVVAGRDYGVGSSRDWAAKGTRLLGVRAILAEGFERIHRSNLIGMGVLPLQFEDGTTRGTLGLDGTEQFDVLGLTGEITPRMPVPVRILRPDGRQEEITMICRLDTAIEVDYYRHGGILHYVLRNTMGNA
ncbi:aconitate hydratase AcnA [Acuticoccus sediminis]|uniref:aconitate hydratase AcnA n=1 Tax=Acuticoccus sediminis TaxID=2184697 RepID=UPI001CFC929B|nr:aconitate hydratase AcnA [Acuticoccus sediminis]